jgi:hypothetical protein
MKSYRNIPFSSNVSGRKKDVVLIWSVLTIAIVMTLSSCRKSMDSGNSFPVNQSVETDLMSKGIPADIARFFAAVKTKSSTPNDSTCIYLQTFPNGATRQITLKVTPNVIYTPTASEDTMKTSNPVYNFKLKFSSNADSSIQKIDMSYFVPQAGLSGINTRSSELMTLLNRNTKLKSVASASAGNEGAGISWSEVVNKGNDVTISSLIDYATEKGIKTGPLGPLYNLASALSDVSTSLQLSQQVDNWLAELNALENCARNPTNPVAKSDHNYSPAAVEKVQSARSELKAVNAVRFLNIMTEKAADLTPVTAVMAVGLKQGFVWSEETLNNYSSNTIMREVKLFVVKCTDPTTFGGNIDVLHDCTDSGPINTIHTQWHTQTNVTWVYNTQSHQYYSQGSYTFDYIQTISGSGSACTIKRSAAGDIGTTGMLMVINDINAQKALGYGYTAVGDLAANVSTNSTCGGGNPSYTENWAITWCPQIRAYTGTGGSYEGMRIDSCISGHGSEKVTWNFVVPPAK